MNYGVGRKYFSTEQKLLILNEYFENKVSISELGRKYQIHPVTIHFWKRNLSQSNNNQSKQDLNHLNLLQELERIKKENKQHEGLQEYKQMLYEQNMIESDGNVYTKPSGFTDGDESFDNFD